MKKRFFSSLLMGALVTATLSTVTSCKDYDDDISNLQGQIDKLATADQLQQKVDELKGLISANSSDINTLKSELAKKTTLDEVKTLLADYATKKYVDDADATLEAAIKALQTKDIAELKTLVEKAQTTADQAKDDASKAKAEIIETLQSYASKTDLDEAKQAAMDAIAALQTSNAAALQEAVDALNNSITEAKNAAKDADDKAVNNAAAIEALGETVTKAAHADSLATANKTAIENASKLLGAGFSEENTVKAAIDAITGQLGAKNTGLADLDSRLSAIETVLNGVKDDDTKLGLSTKITNIETDLRTIIGEYTTMVTSVSLYKTSANRWSNGLPDNDLTFIWVPSEHTTKFPVDGKVADNQIEFSADHKNITITDSLVIRVSPTNAELTPSNVTLINSQGKELSEFVEVQSVKPYKKLITGATRAANETEGNGLWTVTFKLKDGVDIDKFEEATVSQNSYVQFAVAVKNTASSKTRRVITAYDVAAKGSSYEPANNNIPQFGIRNSI